MKFEDVTQPVITNKAPRNTKLSMASHGVKTVLLDDDDEKPEDSSADMENANGKKGEQEKEKQKEKSKKNPNKPSNNKKRPLPETPTNIMTQPGFATTQRPLPETPTNVQQKPANQTLQIHLPEGTVSKERNHLSGNLLPRILSNDQKKEVNPLIQYLATKPDITWLGIGKLTKSTQTDSASKPEITRKLTTKSTQTHTFDKKITVENRASCIILGLKGIIMIAAIFLISSSEEISKAEPCGVEKALKSISLNYTVSCTYDDIKEDSKTLRILGISLLAVNFFFSPLILFFLLLPRICKLVVCILLPLVAIFSVVMIMKHNDILYSNTAEKDMNYVQIQSAMATWLEAHYTSDNISSSDVISNGWNKFFIEYDCCAIHEVQGTTNDFDSTPWCTTAGSCQATASQIPKTCCTGVSEDDYGIAPSTCHSSVNTGTFRSNCMNVIKQLSAVNVEECQLSRLQMSLIIIAILELVATALEIIAVIIWIVLWASNKRKTEKEDKILWAFTKPKSEKEDNKNKENK